MLEISRKADILGVMVFFIFFNYFRTKQNRTTLEKWLYLFSFAGLVLDSIFTWDFLTEKTEENVKR